jgi:hypothetical protein
MTSYDVARMRYIGEGLSLSVAFAWRLHSRARGREPNVLS